MSLLEKIEKNGKKHALFAVIYGGPGTGKTTFGSKMPGSLTFDFDLGMDQIDGANRINMANHSYQEYVDTLIEIGKNPPKGLKTIVIDTEDRLFPLREKHFLAENNISHLGDVGYGKAYGQFRDFHSREITLLRRIRNLHNIHIVILCHAQIKTINEPHLTQEYQLYTLNIPDKHTAILFETADLIGYANIKTVVRKKSGGFGESTTGMVTGERELIITPHTGIHAKNRFGLSENLPLDAEAMLNTIYKKD